MGGGDGAPSRDGRETERERKRARDKPRREESTDRALPLVDDAVVLHEPDRNALLGGVCRCREHAIGLSDAHEMVADGQRQITNNHSACRCETDLLWKRRVSAMNAELRSGG